MAIEVKHATQAAGTDAGNGEIAKTQWNEAHAINMATARVLGRSTAGAGAAEEIAIGGGLTLSAGTLAAEVTATSTTALTNKTIGFSSNNLAGVASTNTAQTLLLKTLTNPIITGAITEDVFAITDGASVDLDPGNGTIQYWSLGANRTATATNFVSGESMTLMVNDGTAYALTWPTITWVGGSAPILSTTGYTVVELWKVTTVLFGAIVGYTA